MLLAIDVGNSHTTFGLWDGNAWVATWRHRTDIESTEDEIGAWLVTMFERARLPFQLQSAACASVVPGIDRTLALMIKKFFGLTLKFLTATSDHKIKVDYTPASGVGADRIANTLAALAKFKPPVVVVDFGTATTFDVIDKQGTYLGGAILAGPITSLAALVSNTAKLPAIELKEPETVIGKSTTHAIQSGIMFGYAGGIDAIVKRIIDEVGEPAKVISTGGLGDVFVTMCNSIEAQDDNLTLDGIRIFAQMK
jgi:type III pantothenate kinase